MKVVIIDYNAGNTQSVVFALNRLGVNATITDDVTQIKGADKIIFPGVGHALPAMQVLRQKGLDKVIKSLKQPVLGICLGMQLLCAKSEEGNTECIGVFDETVKLFEPMLKVPHMGWNTAQGNWALAGSSLSWYYFVHSYYVPLNEFTALTCNYIQPFSAAIKKDNFYGVQFHPEKSGLEGELLLKKFVELT